MIAIATAEIAIKQQQQLPTAIHPPTPSTKQLPCCSHNNNIGVTDVHLDDFLMAWHPQQLQQPSEDIIPFTWVAHMVPTHPA